MILVFHHCGQFIISNMEFLFSWVANFVSPNSKIYLSNLQIFLKNCQFQFLPCFLSMLATQTKLPEHFPRSTSRCGDLYIENQLVFVLGVASSFFTNGDQCQFELLFIVIMYVEIYLISSRPKTQFI